ncbi:MAG: hypothetical protein RSE41_07715 [Clostridia bacterium]
MSNYEKGFNAECNCSSNFNIVSGNSLDLDVNYCESEIRADIVVSEYSSVRLWGRIVNCDGSPIANALIKLLKVECCGDHVTYKGISHTISDCDGFYQFELCTADKDDDCYKLLVSKAAYGPERIIPVSGGNCNPCDDSDGYPFNPCREYPPIVTPKCDVGNGGHCCDEKSNCSCSSCYPKYKY